jgi:putative tryptophan/tyrosine transport system substrate-binding protein
MFAGGAAFSGDGKIVEGHHVTPGCCRLLGAALALSAALPIFATAQAQQAKLPRIGFLGWADGECSDEGLVRGLQEEGLRPGQSVLIECRTAGSDDDGLAPAAAELVRMGVDVIVTTSQPAGRAAHQATTTVPIVTAFSGDPVAGGLARSLAQPGGNVTGVSYYATELSAKRLELLKEAVPSIRTVEVLSNPVVAYLPFEADTKRAAAQLGLDVRVRSVRKPTDLDRVFSAMTAEDAEAVFVLPDLMLAHEAQRIARLALAQRLPTMAWGSWYTEVGCLMSYSARYDQISRRLGHYVARILDGAAPGDLPIEQPTTFELSVNMNTAKSIGHEIPESIMLLADSVIE